LKEVASFQFQILTCWCLSINV